MPTTPPLWKASRTGWDYCTPRVPHQTPMYEVAPDGTHVLSRTWMIFFERLKTCEPAIAVSPEPDPNLLPYSWRYHVSTRRDGRLYLNRLEIDPDRALLESILVQVHFKDEIHGVPDEVYMAEYEMALDHALFGSIERTRWERAIDLPQASILKVGVKIRCWTGDTDWLWSYPAGTDTLHAMDEPPETPLPPVRTMGHKQYQLAVRMVRPVSIGSNTPSLVNAYEEVKAGGPQTFYRAYADVSNSFAKGADKPPIDIPGTVSRFQPTDFKGTGTLTLSGAPGKSTVTLRVNGDAEISLAVEVENTTLNACATDLAAAINATLFGQYFSATAVGAVITLTQLKNYTGTLTASVAGKWTVAAAGITPASDKLNINVGRKYAVQFEGPGGISEASPLSVSTGPVRGSKIVIHGLPPAGADVTAIRILAAPDGQDGPFTLIASIAPSATFANDTHITAIGAEATSSSSTRDGYVDVTVKKRGVTWFSLSIPSNKQRSNIIDALNLGRIEENTIISAEIKHVLELPPTLEKPGRPCDVRLVIE
jgi:hypothetical protein